MKTNGWMRMALLAVGLAPAAWAHVARVSDVHLDATIRDQALFGTLSFHVAGLSPDDELPVLGDDVAVREARLPSGMRLVPSADGTRIAIRAASTWWGGRRSGRVAIDVATVQTHGVTLTLPHTPVRTFSITHDPADVDVDVPGSANRFLKAPSVGGGPVVLTGNFPAGGRVRVDWKPAPARFEASDSVRACRVETVATVQPGVIQYTSTFTFSLTRGSVREYAFRVPKAATIIHTETDFGLLSQTFNDGEDAESQTLTLTARTENRGAVIQLVYEQALPAFPCEATIEPIAPLHVLRTDGFLFVAPKGSVRVLPGVLTHLLQTDAAGLPVAAGIEDKHGLRLTSGNAYRYTTTPSAMQVTVEDVVTAVYAENTIVLDVEDARGVCETTLQLDLRDAPADHVTVRIADMEAWMITAITGSQVAEGDVSRRPLSPETTVIDIPFERPVSGVTRVTIRMERKIDTTEPGTLRVPNVSVEGAVMQNGFIVAAATQGIQLVTDSITRASEIHAASTPIRKTGAQMAYRFRGEDWRIGIGFTRARSTVHSELFHLVSPGDGLLYASTVASFHISGAPADTFVFHVPERLKHVDVTCADMDGWSREGDVLTVRMARRIMGDWTLLIAYEELLDYHGGECLVGEISTQGTESELGFIVLAGPASLQAAEAAPLPEGMIRIDKDEIPAGYAATLLSPVTAAWKYMRAPHAARIRLTPLPAVPMLAQVVDFLSIDTQITRAGASVTRARYSIKNASGQYLSLKLPPRTQLWRVAKLDASGREISEIPSQFDGDVLLVPVERPRDPNQATTIEVQMATDNSASPDRHVILAPVSTQAPVTFVEWTVRAADNLGIRRVRSNLSRDETGSQERFTRTSVLPVDDPLALRVVVAPVWQTRGAGIDRWVLGALAVILFVVFLLRRCRLALAASIAAAGAAAIAQDPFAAMLIPMGVVALLGIGVVRMFVRLVLAGNRRRRAGRPADDNDAPPLVDERAGPASGEGSVRAGLLLGLCLAACAAGALPVAVEALGSLVGGSPGVTVWRADMHVDMDPPSRETDGTVSVRVTHTLDCTFDRVGGYALPLADGTADPFVVLKAVLPDGVALVFGRQEVDESGSPRILLAPDDPKGGTLFVVVTRPGRHRLALTLGRSIQPGVVRIATFQGLQSAVTVRMPEADWDLTADPLHGRRSRVDGDGARVEAGALSLGDALLTVGIVPRRRDVEREALVMSADVDVRATLRPGVVEVVAVIQHRVLQGVLRRMRIAIPDGLHVVNVNGAVEEWHFDAVDRVLTVAVTPAEGDGASVLSVHGNMMTTHFPYSVSLAVPNVLDVTRQNGRLGILAGDAVVLEVGDRAGCSPMRVDDFTFFELPASTEASEPVAVRRAFRYDAADDVSVRVTADAVKPEIRGVLTLALSVGDERNTVSAQLGLNVTKAGVFAVNLDIPDAYVIETLTGGSVVSWDDRRKSGGGVEVYFGGRFLGDTTLHIVLSQQQQGVPEHINVPRIAVTGAARETGRATITAERGVRLTLGAHEGVVAARTEDRPALRHAIVLDLLRADWRATLNTDVLDPVIKPDVLQRIAIVEGMLQHRVFLHSRIENAGVKQFRVVVPVPEASLTVSGRAIARVVPEGDPAADGSQVWLIELQGKVDNTYSATCFYQEPYDAAHPVEVRPMRVLGAQRQTGWIVLSGESRIKVDAEFSSSVLRAEDPRTIPDSFGAGDLSGALGCWKMLDPEAVLSLRVTRHAAADVLPAAVRRIRQTTVLSRGGRTLTQTSVSLAVGRLRFLRVALPGADAEIWTAQVDGIPVRVSREATGLVCIPLDSVPEGDDAEVVFVWADHPVKTLPGPVRLGSVQFPDLPLRDIEWRLHTPSDFAISLKNKDFDLRSDRGWGAGLVSAAAFDRGYYDRQNLAERQGVLKQAKSSFDQVGQMLETGDRSRAQRVLRQAIDLSQADVGLNEDARVQFANVAMENVKVGFMNRRDVLRASQNIFDDEGQAAAVYGFNEGNFSREFVQRIEGRLSAGDRRGLDLVSAKIVGQQTAVSDAAQTISVTMPEQGRAWVFSRDLQTQPGGAMVLDLAVRHRLSARFNVARLAIYFAAAVATPVVWLLLIVAFGRRRLGAIQLC